MTLTSLAQSLDPGAVVALFQLDATSIGAGIQYFCREEEAGAGVQFGGVTYTPVDCEFTGMETSAGGTLPRPRMRVANSNLAFQAIINQYGDMVGCSVRRVRVFERHLDGHADADPSQYFGPDVYRIEQKTDENPIFIEWELSASFDQESKLIPGRPVIRDTCLWRYRVWNSDSSEFDYTKAQCPYTGTSYFDRYDVPTTAENDEPSRRYSCCKARFGDGPYPFGGFLGAARVRS